MSNLFYELCNNDNLYNELLIEKLLNMADKHEIVIFDDYK